MTSKQLSLHHLVHYPTPLLEPGDSSRYPTILALHGRGSNEQDLIGLAPHLPDGFLWISPRAPHKLGIHSYEWYRVQVIGRPDPEKVASALETIDHFIDEILSEYPIDPQKLFLLGFSQGSLLSMCYALGCPDRIAGVIAQSGYIPNTMPETIGWEIKEADVKDKPFILTHGEQDTMIPVDWARTSRDLLQKLGVYLSYYEFQMGHQVSMESLAVISTWLAKQLG
jgi:phospholipase/carboxylesterase